ncbi:MAG: ribosome maturation factor RimP [Synergistaceae bacterium]|nr:ribosome maturation factor RimP [Synergistaceae bacterium]
MDNNFLLRIEEIVAGLGYECVHVSIKSDFGRLRLQVLIDTLGGINVDDCELVSRRINRFLDTSPDLPELDKGRYYLEVSSPGVERPLYKLEDYTRFTGREVRIRLAKPSAGRKTFTGEILGAEGENVKLLCGNEEKHIPFAEIKGANLVYKFNDEHSKGRKKS